MISLKIIYTRRQFCSDIFHHFCIHILNPSHFIRRHIASRNHSYGNLIVLRSDASAKVWLHWVKNDVLCNVPLSNFLPQRQQLYYWHFRLNIRLRTLDLYGERNLSIFNIHVRPQSRLFSIYPYFNGHLKCCWLVRTVLLIIVLRLTIFCDLYLNLWFFNWGSDITMKQ